MGLEVEDLQFTTEVNSWKKVNKFPSAFEMVYD